MTADEAVAVLKSIQVAALTGAFDCEELWRIHRYADDLDNTLVVAYDLGLP